MSISSVKVICGRIREGSVISPIAVFRSKLADHYNAVFADTVMTARLIELEDENLIGVFYGEKGANDFRWTVSSPVFSAIVNKESKE